MAIHQKLPWHIPQELKKFKEITSQHSILLGRKTYESIGKLLPNRQHYIVSHDVNYQLEGAIIVNDLSLFLTEHHASSETIFICGGLEIYKQAFNYCEEFYISVIQNHYEHDLNFMETDWSTFECLNIQEYDEFIHYHYRRKHAQ